MLLSNDGVKAPFTQVLSAEQVQGAPSRLRGLFLKPHRPYQLPRTDKHTERRQTSECRGRGVLLNGDRVPCMLQKRSKLVLMLAQHRECTKRHKLFT